MIQYAPLENWQRDLLSIVREESYYFAPQAMTKIMNEGWATYWHSKMMTEKVLGDEEVIHYADHHSSTLGTSPGSLNPYKLIYKMIIIIIIMKKNKNKIITRRRYVGSLWCFLSTGV